MKIPDRFYKKSLPVQVEGDLKFIKISGLSDTYRMFVRIADGGYNPRRICVEVNSKELQEMHNKMLEEFPFFSIPTP